MHTIEAAISPCPNDTFCFESWIHEDIPLQGYRLSPHYHDIDALNAFALEEKYPFIKISSALYPRIEKKYRYLPSGGAFASQGGPLVVAREHIDLNKDANSLTIAIPGLYTSAYAAFRLLYGAPKKVIVIPYNRIAKMLALDSAIDAGILIHEERFTFSSTFHGSLVALSDLHFRFREQFSSPLPLGLIAVHRDLGQEAISALTATLKRSISHALQRPQSRITPFIVRHASEISEEAIEQHIQMYVTPDTLEISQEAAVGLQHFFSALR